MSDASQTSQTSQMLQRLLREDLRGFAGYSSARSSAVQGDVWLNANESAWASAGDAEGRCRRYPDPQPVALRARLAEVYGCAPEQVLIGRGSDEAIDLLVRALCTPARDAVLVTPPVFGMYAVSARLQGAALLEVPLVESEAGLVADIDAIIAAALAAPVKIVFLCSPSNPAGSAIALADVERVAMALRGRALVVVDEAYIEYADGVSATTLMDALDNLAVLRTLSKAHALAAARIGCVIARAELIGALRSCQAPYPVPAPCSELALRGLDDAGLALTHERITVVRAERQRLLEALQASPLVRRAYPSQGNYLLARFHDAQGAFDALLTAGIVVRDQRAAPALGDALRISIGTPEQNDRVLAVLAAMKVAA